MSFLGVSPIKRDGEGFKSAWRKYTKRKCPRARKSQKPEAEALEANSTHEADKDFIINRQNAP